MSKSEEMLRLERELNGQPELREKLNAEMKRIAEAGEAVCDGVAMVKAAAALGYDVTLEELERAAADLEKLDDSELEAAGGKAANSDKRKIVKDGQGHETWCLGNWHCYAVMLHAETDSEEAACWKNYDCLFVQKNT